jgi:DHA2 family methylenomycin A resistance protein-like MFS transporter
MTKRSPTLALAVAALGYMLVLLDVTIVNVALEDIGTGLGADRAELQWVVDAYAVTLASLMLSAGHLADRFGCRRIFRVGIALFGAASIGCALAPSAPALIAARVVQGVGAAALLPASLALVTASNPDPRARVHAIGIWAGIGSLGLAAGPVIGGELVGALGWRSVFWLGVPVCALALVATARVAESSRHAADRPFDIAGQIAGTVALVALVGALVEGGRSGWSSAPILAALCVSVASFAALIAVELRADWPMLDLRFFRRPAFSGANFGALAMNAGVLGALFALSLLLQGPGRLSPEETGLRLLPLALPLAILSPVISRLIERTSPRLPAALGLAGTGAGFAALAALGTDPATPALLAALLLAGVSLAFATPGVVAAANAAAPADRAGMASAVNNTARQTGGAVGVAVIGAIAGSAAFAVSAGVLAIGGLACGLLIQD